MTVPPSDFVARAEWLSERLSPRDVAIIETVHALHLMTGRQIETLFFFDLLSAFRVRARVLQRLVERRALIRLPRIVGGFSGGSGPSMYTCDAAAIALIMMRRGYPVYDRPKLATRIPPRLRDHVLAVSEFYTRLVVTAREAGDFEVVEFQTEPDSWWPNRTGEILRPDAYTAIGNDRYIDRWWIEIDMGTESPAAITAKLANYLAFARSGAEGPDGTMPRVLFTAPSLSRKKRLRQIVQDLPSPALDIFRVAEFGESMAYLAEELALETGPSVEGE